MRLRVAIVGGGISGLSTAYFLSREAGGEGVAVFERSFIGSGSTFRCATGIRASFTTEEHIVLMKRSIELWNSLAKELGFYLRHGGYLWLLQEEHVEVFKQYSELHNRYGVPTRIVDPGFVEELVPTINRESFYAALYDPMAMQADPFTTLYSLAHSFRESGGRIEEGVAVKKIVVEKGSVRGVLTDRGFVEAEAVVVAAGRGSRELLSTAGVDAPLTPIPKHALITMRYDRLFDPLLIDWRSSSYIVQTKFGGFIIGAELGEEPGGVAQPRIEYIPCAVKIWGRYFPWLPKVYILRYWTGYYIMTPDHHPIYGPVDGVEGLYVAAGFSGHGFMLGPATGYVMSRWILRGDPGIEQAKRLTLRRFAEGRLIHEKAVFG